MLTTEALYTLLPHDGRMCLIDELIEWDAQRILCRTRSHLAADNPLRSDQGLDAVHAIEYGAQAIGLHGGRLARAAGEPARGGVLVSVREVELHRERLDDTAAPLTIEAQRLLADDRNLLYAFALSLDHEPVASGRAAIITHGES